MIVVNLGGQCILKFCDWQRPMHMHTLEPNYPAQNQYFFFWAGLHLLFFWAELSFFLSQSIFLPKWTGDGSSMSRTTLYCGAWRSIGSLMQSLKWSHDWRGWSCDLVTRPQGWSCDREAGHMTWSRDQSACTISNMHASRNGKVNFQKKKSELDFAQWFLSIQLFIYKI